LDRSYPIQQDKAKRVIGPTSTNSTVLQKKKAERKGIIHPINGRIKKHAAGGPLWIMQKIGAFFKMAFKTTNQVYLNDTESYVAFCILHRTKLAVTTWQRRSDAGTTFSLLTINIRENITLRCDDMRS
jgi:hypothetical protein